MPGSYRKFLLFEGASPIEHPLAECRMHQGGSVRLACHLIDVFPVIDAAGRSVGLIMGCVIDPATSRRLRGEIRLSCAAGDFENPGAFVEAAIHPFAGSFVFILDAPPWRHVYMDAGETLPVVFDPARRCAGSTAAVLMGEDEYEARVDAALRRQLDSRKNLPAFARS